MYQSQILIKCCFKWNNEIEKHTCQPNVFKDFCCGNIYKQHDVFKFKNTVQLQLGCDEFEPLDYLKSKAGLHKMCGIYLEIRNIAPHCKSKINNHFEVAMVKVADLKQQNCSYDDIVEPIVKELKQLETDGFFIDKSTNLKAVLVGISCDNLGANSLLGFTECFNSHFYCRICECSKLECKYMCKTVPEKMRSNDNYKANLRMIPQDGDDIDLKLTKGIKRYCLFNNLKYFNIFDNFTIDPMHDHLEGNIPFFLKQMFTYLIKNQITSCSILESKLRDFSYGFLYKKYKPSVLNLKKHSLGQNAKQIHCIFIFLPFILYEYKEKMGKFWPALEDLLTIIQIIFSNSISEVNIVKLDNLIEKHLFFIVNELNVDLVPKHHMLVHYPESIRKMGPPIYNWMMRVESKHKQFTDMVKRTSNFVNLPKSVTWTHQENRSYSL